MFWPGEPRPHHSDLQTVWYEPVFCICCQLTGRRHVQTVFWVCLLTGGQKARVVFAELCCRQPDVLILVSFTEPLIHPADCSPSMTNCFYPRMSPPTIWTLSQSMLYQRPSMNIKEVRCPPSRINSHDNIPQIG